jgi:hypothetical protein
MLPAPPRAFPAGRSPSRRSPKRWSNQYPGPLPDAGTPRGVQVRRPDEPVEDPAEGHRLLPGDEEQPMTTFPRVVGPPRPHGAAPAAFKIATATTSPLLRLTAKQYPAEHYLVQRLLVAECRPPASTFRRCSAMPRTGSPPRGLPCAQRRQTHPGGSPRTPDLFG